MFAELAAETKKVYESIQKIDLSVIIEDITKKENIQRWIKDTIKGRIQTKGIDAKGNKMQTDRSSPGEPYSDYTMDLKDTFGSGFGNVISHVTLTQEGDFWESLRVTIIQKGFRTEADFIKKDGHMYKNFTQDYTSQEDFENAVTGMTENELKELFTDFYAPLIIKKINEILQN
jgi:hypothetical protein